MKKDTTRIRKLVQLTSNCNSIDETVWFNLYDTCYDIYLQSELADYDHAPIVMPLLFPEYYCRAFKWLEKYYSSYIHECDPENNKYCKDRSTILPSLQSLPETHSRWYIPEVLVVTIQAYTDLIVKQHRQDFLKSAMGFEAPQPKEWSERKAAKAQNAMPKGLAILLGQKRLEHIRNIAKEYEELQAVQEQINKWNDSKLEEFLNSPMISEENLARLKLLKVPSGGRKWPQ